MNRAGILDDSEGCRHYCHRERCNVYTSVSGLGVVDQPTTHPVPLSFRAAPYPRFPSQQMHRQRKCASQASAMSTIWIRRLSSRPISAPRRFPTSGFPALDHTKKHDEEKWTWYSPQAFYPARIGETFKAQYQIIGKLGCGTRSTVWLGRDLQYVAGYAMLRSPLVYANLVRSAHKYVTMKICEKDCASSARELAAYKHLAPITTENIGALFIRDLYDDFKIQGLEGEHLCLIHEPLGISLDTFRRTMPLKRFSESQLKVVLIHLLQALDCLHRDAKMIHTGELYVTCQAHRMTSLTDIRTDVQAMNIHLRTADDSVWKNFEQGEMINPRARKSNGPHVIYDERGLIWTGDQEARPVLCDFGEARFGQGSYTDDVQPYSYRAPEVILKIPWSYEVDIWNVGVMVSFCQRLFEPGSCMLTFVNRFGTCSRPDFFSLPAIKMVTSAVGSISRPWSPLLGCLRLNCWVDRRPRGSTSIPTAP